MAVAYRSSSHTTYVEQTSIAINKPSGLAVGDILVAALHIETGTDPNVTGTGFTLEKKAYISNGGSDIGMAILWKRATSGDAAASSFSFSWTGTFYCTGDLHAFSGQLGTSSPFTGGTITTSGASTTIPSLSYTAGDGLGIWMYTEYVDDGTVTKPASYTQAWFNGDGDMTLATRSDTAGATTTGTGTTNSTNPKVVFAATLMNTDDMTPLMWVT